MKQPQPKLVALIKSRKELLDVSDALDAINLYMEDTYVGVGQCWGNLFLMKGCPKLFRRSALRKRRDNGQPGMMTYLYTLVAATATLVDGSGSASDAHRTFFGLER